MHVQNPLFESFPIFVASSIVSGKGFPKVSGRNMANVPATEATTPIITIIAKLLGMYPIRMEQIPPTRAAGKSQNTTYNIEEGSCHILNEIDERENFWDEHCWSGLICQLAREK